LKSFLRTWKETKDVFTDPRRDAHPELIRSAACAHSTWQFQDGGDETGRKGEGVKIDLPDSDLSGWYIPRTEYPHQICLYSNIL